jgi:hypothetical protein
VPASRHAHDDSHRNESSATREGPASAVVGENGAPVDTMRRPRSPHLKMREPHPDPEKTVVGCQLSPSFHAFRIERFV